MPAQKEPPSGHLVPLYAVPIHDAIGSGDVGKMSAVRDQALAHLAAAADVTKLLPALEKAIQSKGGPIRPLYAVAIQDAMTRGDPAEIARIKAELASYNSMLESGSTTVTPYGIAIQDAKARGDKAEVLRLTALAESLLAKLNATK